MLFTINPENPQLRLINQVIKQMKSGAIICYPTDTGYGIGCDLFDQKAIKRIIQLKKRPKQKPFSSMCSDLTHISEYAHVSNSAYRLLKRNLPGPYTFVLPGSKLVPKIMLTRRKTAGIRVPDHPICLALVEALGNPIISTSAKTPEGAIFENPSLIHDYFKQRIVIVIDGGPIAGRPSSVVSLIDDTPEVIRKGIGDVSSFE